MSDSTTIKDTTANPAPLGLLAFGMTTVLLNLHNAGFFELGSVVLGMGIFYGGLAQVIAGIMEWKKNNTFGTTAFHLLWDVLADLCCGRGATKASAEYPPSKRLRHCLRLLVIWGLFTAVMFFATLRLNRALQVVFGTLVILFFLLALGDFLENAGLKRLGGFEGIICGLSAMYTGLAQVLNEAFGRTVLPLGPVAR